MHKNTWCERSWQWYRGTASPWHTAVHVFSVSRADSDHEGWRHNEFTWNTWFEMSNFAQESVFLKYACQYDVIACIVWLDYMLLKQIFHFAIIINCCHTAVPKVTILIHFIDAEELHRIMGYRSFSTVTSPPGVAPLTRGIVINARHAVLTE